MSREHWMRLAIATDDDVTLEETIEDVKRVLNKIGVRMVKRSEQQTSENTSNGQALPFSDEDVPTGRIHYAVNKVLQQVNRTREEDSGSNGTRRTRRRTAGATTSPGDQLSV